MPRRKRTKLDPVLKSEQAKRASRARERRAPPPDQTGKSWKGQRGFSTASLIAIAQTRNAYLVTLDFHISERKQRHILFDQNGEAILHTKYFEEIVWRMREDGITNLVIVNNELPKPAFCAIYESATRLKRKKDHG